MQIIKTIQQSYELLSIAKAKLTAANSQFSI